MSSGAPFPSLGLTERQRGAPRWRMRRGRPVPPPVRPRAPPRAPPPSRRGCGAGPGRHLDPLPGRAARRGRRLSRRCLGRRWPGVAHRATPWRQRRRRRRPCAPARSARCWVVPGRGSGVEQPALLPGRQGGEARRGCRRGDMPTTPRPRHQADVAAARRWTCELAALAAARQGRRRLAVARRSRRRGRGHRLSHRLATRRCPGAAAMCASLARAPPAD